ncbi:hypothetical protein ACW0JT_08850 [Arthrobacter sp. SA17]
MTNPSDAPQSQQPGGQPADGNVPPTPYQQPPAYQAPQAQQPPQGYPAGNYQTPDGYQASGQPGYGAPAGAANNAPPAGLGYAAPARNTLALDFNNIKERVTNTQGVPQQLVISYWLWVGAAVLGVVASLVAMAGAAGGFAGVGLIFSLIWAAVYIFIAIRLKEGARWARLVLSILGGLSVLALPLTLFTGGLSLIGTAATIAAAVMMWLPQSQQHFKG